MEIYFEPFLHTFGEKEEYAVHAKDVHKIAMVTKPLDKWLAKYEACDTFNKDGYILNYHMAYLILIQESNRPEARHCLRLAWELDRWAKAKQEADMKDIYRDYLRRSAEQDKEIAALDREIAQLRVKVAEKRRVSGAKKKAQARKRTTHS